MQNGPFCVLVIIVSQRVILFPDDIYERGPSGIGLEHSRHILLVFLTLSFPPFFDIGDRLKERKGDLLPVEKIVDKKIPF